ncbi:MAG: hypothetical protein K2L10_04680 [Ruminococcus sp.]|nr:hypothetical protein [Ruminococcus sp.]
MSVNGMCKNDWKTIDKQLTSLNNLCNALGEIPKNIDYIIDGDEDRKNYLEEHNKDINEDFTDKLTEINSDIECLSSLYADLKNIIEKLEELQDYK